MRKHFSKEIQLNRTDPAITKQKKIANAAMTKTMEDDTDRQAQIEMAVLQTKKIQELEERLNQQMANSATNTNIPGRIPASIDSSDSRRSFMWKSSDVLTDS